MCKHASETDTFLKCLAKTPINICSMEDKRVPGLVLVCVRGGQAQGSVQEFIPSL